MIGALLLISDGRAEYLERTLASIDENLPRFNHVIHVDDSDHQLGFAGAIREGWERVLSTDADWVWHAEQDFTYDQPVPLAKMIALLERNHYLAQVSLKRQAWSTEEGLAGGFVELHPDDYTERSDRHATWTEHRRFFTTNPSVYSSRLCRVGWPNEAHSEGLFTHKLLTDPLLRFAFWGGKHGPPLCTHIGMTRDGVGY